jgi:hypothetical protein
MLSIVLESSESVFYYKIMTEVFLTAGNELKGREKYSPDHCHPEAFITDEDKGMQLRVNHHDLFLRGVAHCSKTLAGK